MASRRSPPAGRVVKPAQQIGGQGLPVSPATSLRLYRPREPQGTALRGVYKIRPERARPRTGLVASGTTHREACTNPSPDGRGPGRPAPRRGRAGPGGTHDYSPTAVSHPGAPPRPQPPTG